MWDLEKFATFLGAAASQTDNLDPLPALSPFWTSDLQHPTTSYA